MAAGRKPEERSQEFWRDFLTHPDSLMQTGRHVFRRLPSDPRCLLCAAPFTGIGGGAMRLIGKRQSQSNPTICTSCENVLIRYHGGAEVPAALLFADIRGSTSLAETMTPTEFRALLDRFYTVATTSVFAHGGIVDKFVGDELVAAFAPMIGDDYVARAVDTARELLEKTGHAAAEGPWAPTGAGVHAGDVWFGVVGEGARVEMTVLGDPVNVTARLAATAAAGEILVTAHAAKAAGLDPSLARRSLELKGKAEATDVVSLRVGPSPAASTETPD
jgi:adenylate cyclase